MLLPRRLCLLLAPVLGLLLLPRTASPIDFLDGRIQIHGYAQEMFRTMSDHFDLNAFYVSQWATVLNLEMDANLAPNGFGPFSLAKISFIEVPTPQPRL
mgnify:CR=1 FL=1